MNKEELPQYSTVDQWPRQQHARRHHRKRRVFRLLTTLCLGFALWSLYTHGGNHERRPSSQRLSVGRLHADHATCHNLRQSPQDPHGARERNARYVDGQKPILIRNATVWTGEPTSSVTEEEARQGKGFQWIPADILIDGGLIVRVDASILDQHLPADCEVIDAQTRLVTTGIVDMHSHTGVDSLPELEGNEDTNELSNDITPYVRSIDGLNPLDHQIQVIKSGGVTTSLILPGSGNNMGGEAFVIKHAVGAADGRSEISIADMLADPDRNHRYMKMACGENAKSVYGTVGRGFGPFSRLGEAFYFRHAFEEATKLKTAQDDWCATADHIGAQHMDTYLPMDLKWESLSAVLRGQVMVNTHCYTIPDLESFIGYTNEFKFPVRAFHHAHQTYLVPEVLKRVYGGRAPAAALFADNMNYKAESYVASEQAGKILWEAGITPVYVSDNPVLNAQHVLFEAAKAYQNGLPYHVALAGVTSASAELLGLGNRIGKVKAGFDADLVIWDSDPLSVGATPLQVFIDGTPQFKHPVELQKPPAEPMTAAWKHRDLAADPMVVKDLVLTGIAKIQLPGHESQFEVGAHGVVVVEDGKIVCIGSCETALATAQTVLALENGHVVPPLTAFGSVLGLEEIAAEVETSDSANDQNSFSAAVDGLLLDSKNLRAAYAHGVTRAISAPAFKHGGHKGLSAGIRTGATHALAAGAVFGETVALHYTLTPAAKQGSTPSLSSAVAELRTKLLRALDGGKKKQKKTEDETPPSAEQRSLAQVVAGELPLVIDVQSADIMAALVRVKREVEAAIQAAAASSSSSTKPAAKLRLVVLGGAEAHMLAAELAAADVAVILAPLFAYSSTWDERRSLTGAPLTNGTAIDVLHAAGVQVAIGVDEDWEARDLFVQAGQVFANGNGNISGEEALALASSRIYDILGLPRSEEDVWGEFVIFEGDPLGIQSQVRAVADGRGAVSVWA